MHFLGEKPMTLGTGSKGFCGAGALVTRNVNSGPLVKVLDLLIRLLPFPWELGVVPSPHSPRLLTGVCLGGACLQH